MTDEQHPSNEESAADQPAIDPLTVGELITLQEAMDQLRDRSVSPGRPSAVAPAARADRAHALHDPKGCGSDDAIRVWLFAQHGVTMTTDAVGTLVRRRCGASPTCRGPSPQKDADPIATFQTDVTDRIRARIPPTTTKPIWLLALWMW